MKVNMNKYNCTFPAMIDDWRKKFHKSSGTTAFFPFGFVQVKPYSDEQRFFALYNMTCNHFLQSCKIIVVYLIVANRVQRKLQSLKGKF